MFEGSNESKKPNSRFEDDSTNVEDEGFRYEERKSEEGKVTTDGNGKGNKKDKAVGGDMKRVEAKRAQKPASLVEKLSQ